MEESYLYSYADSERDGFVFWSNGNYPTQNSLSLSYEDVQMNFKILFLLSNKIFASSSFYYESEITRFITRTFCDIFNLGHASYFIDENIANYTEHGLLKMHKSPLSLDAYRDKQTVIIHGKTLDSLGVLVRRKPESISKRMQYLWVEDIFTNDSYSLGAFLKRVIRDSTQVEDISLKLSAIAVDPPVDFIWEYITSAITPFERLLPKGFSTFARKRLSEIYTLANGNILDMSLDCTLLDTVSQYDSKLFCDCMEAVGALSTIRLLSPSELLSLKNRQEFMWFRNVYFELIESANYTQGVLQKSFDISKDIVEQPHLKANAKSLVKGYFNGSDAKLKKMYKKPVDTLLSAYDTIVNDNEKKKLIEYITRLPFSHADNYFIVTPTIGKEFSQMLTDVLVLVAKDEEFSAVENKDLWAKRHLDTAVGDKVPLGFTISSKKGGRPDIKCVLVQTGKGNVYSASVAATAIATYKPEVVILTGILAGIINNKPDERDSMVVNEDKSIKLGDIIVVEQTIAYEPGKVTQNGKEPRTDEEKGDALLLTTARSLPRSDWENLVTEKRPLDGLVDVHFGKVLSGEKVLGNTDYIKEITPPWVKVIGAEMESYGVATAVRKSYNKSRFIAVKSVSDFADSDKNDVWHPYCMDIAASYTIALIRTISFEGMKCKTPGESSVRNSQNDSISGPNLVKMNKRLLNDLYKLADYLDIPEVDRIGFDRSRPASMIYEWLSQRGKGSNEFWDAVRGIERGDVYSDFNGNDGGNEQCRVNK